MPDTERMERIRQRQAEHNAQVESAAWFTTKQLATRWTISVSTVLEIPASVLPYRPFGLGKRPRRRYSPAAVHAFEQDDTRYSAAS